MSLDSLIYLLEFYWPFLLAAMFIGARTGWVNTSVPKNSGVRIDAQRANHP